MIREIDAQSVTQLTSGQVVTSLASAVKELVENAIDARANAVTVSVVNYGLDGFSVADDGCGVRKEDIPQLAKQHSTSKLCSLTDLAGVETLGFRGEALASLCTLAKVRITTNSGEDGANGAVEVGLNSRATKRVAAPRGTRVAVADLFYTFPVRRKDFQKNAPKEYAKTVALVQEIAVLNNIKLTFTHTLRNKSVTVLQSHGATLVQRIACVFGAKRARTLQNVDFNLGNAEIQGCIAARGDSACQLLAVNGRPVRIAALQRAIVDVYKQHHAEPPFYVLNLVTNPANYDVNVSPDKRSILLHNEPAIVENLRAEMEKLYAVDYTELEIAPKKQRTLESYSFKQPKAPQTKTTEQNEQNGLNEQFEQNEQQNEQFEQQNEQNEQNEHERCVLKDIKEETDAFAPPKKTGNTGETDAFAPPKKAGENSRLYKTVNTHVFLSVDVASIPGEPEKERKLQKLQQTELEDGEQTLSLRVRKRDFAAMQVIGQFNLGFILVKNGQDVLILDQHACDEIYNFETLQTRTVMHRQPLVSPITLELSAVEELLVQDHLQTFLKNGFVINTNSSAKPTRQCVLASVPYSKNTVFNELDVYDLVGQIRRDPANSGLKCRKLRAMFAMRACRSSIMIGTPLDKPTMQRVVRNLGSLDKPWNCPHGRPTLRHLTSLQ